jgi:hypothetical protein
VDIEFGGPVFNNWKDFEAEAKIKRHTADVIAVETTKSGGWKLLKGNYSADIIVGPTDIITD